MSPYVVIWIAYARSFNLDAAPREDDLVFGRDGVALVVDAVSYEFVRGASVDFTDSLIKTTFEVLAGWSRSHTCSRCLSKILPDVPFAYVFRGAACLVTSRFRGAAWLPTAFCASPFSSAPRQGVGMFSARHVVQVPREVLTGFSAAPFDDLDAVLKRVLPGGQVVQNPNSASSCGCGSSFAPKF